MPDENRDPAKPNSTTGIRMHATGWNQNRTELPQGVEI
jgi:hypothetical protein